MGKSAESRPPPPATKNLTPTSGVLHSVSTEPVSRSDIATAPLDNGRRVEHLGQSLADYSASRLRMLCEGADLGNQADDIVGTFRKLVSPWANRALHDPSKWVSEISDDNTPIEFSITLDRGGSDVRVLFEPPGRKPTLESYRSAALAFHDRLENEFGASLARFRQIQDLFVPEGMCGPFAIWNSVVFEANKPPSFKSYFNPQALGVGRACALVEEALGRLGFPQAWARLCRTSVARGPWLDELKYFALDLTDDEHARVKVYVRHHGASPDDLERACSAAVSYRPDEASEFASAMGGGREVLSERATFTCNAFVEGEGDRPVATTLYVPVCAYAPNDEVIRDRVSRYLHGHGFDAGRYDKLLRCFADRPLADGVGMQSWVAFRRYEEAARLTVYLASEAGCVYSPGSVPAATNDRQSFSSPAHAVASLASHRLSDHPVVVRSRIHPDASLLWALATSLLDGVISPWEASRQEVHPLTLILNEVVAATEGDVPNEWRKHAGKISEHLRVEITGRGPDDELAPGELLTAASLYLHDTIPGFTLAERGPGLLPTALEARLAELTNDTQHHAQDLAGHLYDRSSEGEASSASRAAFVAHQLLWSALDEVYCVGVEE